MWFWNDHKSLQHRNRIQNSHIFQLKSFPARKAHTIFEGDINGFWNISFKPFMDFSQNMFSNQSRPDKEGYKYCSTVSQLLFPFQVNYAKSLLWDSLCDFSVSSWKLRTLENYQDLSRLMTLFYLTNFKVVSRGAISMFALFFLLQIQHE